MYGYVHNLLLDGPLNKDGSQWCNPSDPVCLVLMGVLLLWLAGTTVYAFNKAIYLTGKVEGVRNYEEECKFITVCVCMFNEVWIALAFCLVSIFCSGLPFLFVLSLLFTYIVLLHVQLIRLARFLGLLKISVGLYSMSQIVMAFVCRPWV